jgi:hypothetical protein
VIAGLKNTEVDALLEGGPKRFENLDDVLEVFEGAGV